MSNFNWIEVNGKNGRGAYFTISADGYEYEVGFHRMDDEHNRMYPNSGTGFKYYCSIDTTELFYPGGDITGLSDDYAMTFDEAKEKCEKMFADRKKFRKEWFTLR